MSKIVDARGMKCPKPLMMVKETLKGMVKNETAIILLGSTNAKNNIEKMLSDHAIKFQTTTKDQEFEILFTKNVEGTSPENAEEYCSDSKCK